MIEVAASIILIVLIMLKTKITMSKMMSVIGLGFLIGLGVMAPIGAQTVTQGYGADEPLQRGMIVKLKKEDTTKVAALTIETIEEMHGVVVDSQDAPVTLSQEGQRFFVAKTGKFDVLVDTQNGPIQSGDFITISALTGIGMKASNKEPFIIGRALSSFDGSINAIGTSSIKDASGASRPVSIGRVSADISIARNPLLKAHEPSVPEFLRRASEALAGKQVPAVRIYIGLVIFAVSTVIAGSLLYSGVRSAIISIGRNPLSKKSILKGMFQVILTGLTIFLLGIFGVYLLLKI